MEEVRYMISDAAKRVGVEAHVLRYWQKQLELPISRNEMEQRYYKDSDIELFTKVKHLMEKGFQLKAIKMLLSDIDKPELQGIEETMNHQLSGEEKVFLMEEQKENSSGTSLIMEQSHELNEESNSKLDQFGAILNHIILNALKENNSLLSKEISGSVTEGVVREMNYLMRIQEEKEEERYRKFDATLRDYQKSRGMYAAALDKHKRKKSKFFKKNRVYI